MKNEKQKESRFQQIRFGGFLVIIFITYFIVVSSIKTIENFRLKRTGIYTKAIVYDQRHVGSKGVIKTYYEFMVDGKHYQGSSINNDNAKNGDTLNIVFLKSNPKVNRPKTFLGIK